MDIYRGKNKIGSLPDKVKIPNRFFTRLKGINIDQRAENAEIEGVYRSLFGFWNSGGVRCIDISLGEKQLTVFISRFFPFVNVLQTDRTLFGSEE